MKCLFFIGSFFFAQFCLASAKVCVEGSELKVYSNLIFYGSKAQSSGAACAKEIHNMFNAPNTIINVGGKDLKVKFEVSYQIENEDTAIASININKRVENNYIRIEEKAENQEWGRSNHILGGNCGFYAFVDKLGSSTTCAHEFAHGLGLEHYNERDDNGYGHNGDLRGKGAPGIMAARGFIVDKEYQYNINASPGQAGGTINPKNRVVRSEDIEDLNLETLNFDDDGCAPLGTVTGFGYESDGDVTTGNNWYVFDALNYINNSLLGNLSEPIYCH